jgi:hypothetical protein
MDTQTVTIKTGYIKSQIKNGRVEAGGRLHLDVSRIRRILAYGGNYYIEYITDSDYYKQYIEAPPPLAVELKYSIEEYKVDVCDKCGSQIEWDADEPFCPNGCDERYDDWSYHTETRRRFVVKSSVFDEVEQFIEKAFGVKAELVDSLFRNMAGGYTPQFKLLEIDVTLREAHLTGLAVVENPVFVYSDYDSADTSERRYDGKYIVAEVYAGGFHRLLYKYEGEPDLSALQRLHEEYLAKKREEEERRRRAEEEMERRRREEEEKWGDPAKVVDAIRAALPDWADGAVVVAKSVCGEDCDVYYDVYPIKRSQRGGFYYSSEWRQLKLEVPDRFLAKLADTVVLRNGKTVKVKSQKNGGKYITLTT